MAESCYGLEILTTDFDFVVLLYFVERQGCPYYIISQRKLGILFKIIFSQDSKTKSIYPLF